jgi:hydrogenase expression/formation protein HypC
MCLAIPGQIISIDRAGGDPLQCSGEVSFGGIIKRVSLAYVPEAVVGDYAIVHVGFALSIVDREEARETLQYLDRLELQNANLGESD